MVWAIEQPTAGIVEADELDYRARARGGASPISARSSAPTATGRPCDNRAVLFPEDIDPADPWQFKNILVG